jgi:hypothetical protein
MAPGFLSSVALAYAVVVATFPDERMYVATNWLHGSMYLDYGQLYSPDASKLYRLLAPINTLDLKGESLIDEEKLVDIIEKNKHTAGAQRRITGLLLKNRDLTGANLEGVDVRYVDFTEAILNLVNLDSAWATMARFGFAQLQGASLFNTRLQGSLFGNAIMRGAALDGAQLQGALLGIAASNYTGSGAGPAQLEGASFENACISRADARLAAWKNAMVVHRETNPTVDKMDKCEWTAASFAALKQDIADEVPEGANKRAAMEKIEQRLDPTKSLEGEDEMAKFWADRERESLTPEAYTKALAAQFRELGCAADGAPYVLHALIDRLSFQLEPFSGQSYEAKTLAAYFLDAAHCAAAHGLSENDKEELKKIAVQAAPQVPKP